MFKDAELLVFYKLVDLQEPMTIWIQPYYSTLEYIKINSLISIAILLPLVFLYSKNPQSVTVIENYKNGKDRYCYVMSIDDISNSNVKKFSDFYEHLKYHQDNQEIAKIIKFIDKLMLNKKLDYLSFEFICYEKQKGI